MPRCPPVCRRAVQRQILPQANSLWISEDILSKAFQRFTRVSNTAKRYGSFVPGPLESRRRLGKRRMAYASESTPTSPYALSSLWAIFGEIDRTKFQWEAPNVRPTIQEAFPDGLENWFTGRITPPAPEEDDTKCTEDTKPTAVAVQDAVSLPHVLHFRASLRDGDIDEAIHSCQKFNTRLKQSLALGEVTVQTLRGVLVRGLIGEIRKAFPDTKSADLHCLALYQAIWDGISVCKVFGPSEIPGELLGKLLKFICEIQITPETQTLAGRVVRSVSVSQLPKMHDGICQFLLSWLHSGIGRKITNNETYINQASKYITQNQQQLLHLDGLISSLEHRQDKDNDLEQIRKYFSILQSSIIMGIQAIDRAENSLDGLEGCITGLDGAISNIPKNVLWGIIKACTQRIADVEQKMDIGTWLELERFWLFFVMDKLSTNQLFCIWQKFDTSGGFLRRRLFAIILLRHWAHQGCIKNPLLVENAFKSQSASQQNFACLLLALKKYKCLDWKRVEEIFDLMHRSGKSEMVYEVFKKIQPNGVRVPPQLITRSLSACTAQNQTGTAYKIVGIWVCQTGSDKAKFLRFNLCQNFVLSMIDDRAFCPKQIWRMLNIPVYEDLPERKLFAGFTNDPKDRLSVTMEELIIKMATAFSRAEHLRPRVALRNVIQCFHHLRSRGAKVTPELTRAITHSGVTRELIRRNGKIAKGRVRWAIGLIDWVEGKHVAESVDYTIGLWIADGAKGRAAERRLRKALPGHSG